MGLMRLELLFDLARLAFFVVGAYLVLQAWARRRRPDWARHLTLRRLAVLGVLTLAMSAVKVIEDVVAHESGPVDTALLWFVREHVPAALTGFFGAVTWSGSARALVPASGVAVVALLVARRRFEALLMGSSMGTATLLVYALKALVGRARPALWQTDWYWGSSWRSAWPSITGRPVLAELACASAQMPRADRATMWHEKFRQFAGPLGHRVVADSGGRQPG
jgi:undecaprenyl-diphosphatase